MGFVLNALLCCRGEDNALLVWNVEEGVQDPQIFPFPKLTQGSGYLLPILTQSVSSPSHSLPLSVHFFPSLTYCSSFDLFLPLTALLPSSPQSNGMCAAGAVNDNLCIWRVKDGVTVTELFPELITALQWKPGQRDSETPLLVVGLVGGDLVMVEVMGARINMNPTLQLTRLEHFGRGGGRKQSLSLATAM